MYRRYIRTLAVVLSIGGLINFSPAALFFFKPEVLYYRAWEFFDEVAYLAKKEIAWDWNESGDLSRKYLVHFQESTRTSVSTDRDGFRLGRPEEGQLRILVSGDSFIFGSGLSDQETMPWRLSHYLGRPVFNGGRTSLENNLANPALENIEIVIEGVAERNCRSERFNKPIVFPPETYFKPLARKNMGMVAVLRNVRPALYGLFPIAVRFSKRLINDAVFLISGGVESKYLYLDHRMPERELNATVKAITKRSRALTSAGLTYVFVGVPAKQSLYKMDVDPFTKNYLHLLNEGLRLNRVNVIDLAREFGRQKENKQLYFRYDTHWRSAGADLAAEVIAREISDLEVFQLFDQSEN